MKDVIIKCDKGEVKKVLANIEKKNHRPLAYIEEIDGISYNRCYLIEVKGLVKA